MRHGDSCAHSRMKAVNPEAVKQFFDLLEYTMKELNLLFHPAQVYNVEKNEMQLNLEAPNVSAKQAGKGQI